MSGATVTGGGTVTSVDPAWRVAAIGDLNQDGNSDIVWQNTNGTALVWEMNGAALIGGGTIAQPGPTWHVVGIGDFSDNNFGSGGQSDILWQNDNGTVQLWQMSGTSVIGGGTIADPGPTWHVVATGDFYGNGNGDILWQNDNGTVLLWEMSGTSVIGGGTIADPGPTWRVAATGDYNGDGKSDILWQNNDGTTVIWDMSGTSLIGGGSLGNPGPTWRPTGNDSMRFITSAATSNTTFTASGADEFVFTSFTAGPHMISQFNTAHDIIEFSKADYANFTALQASLTTSGSSTLIPLGGNSSLLLESVLPSSLHSSNFVFV
jgi:hypothetical protein